MPRQSKCKICGQSFTPGFIFKAEDMLLCDKCRQEYANSADLYCLKCGRFVGKVSSKKLDNGFEVKKGDVLHVTHCPACSTDESSVILELEEWNAKRQAAQNN